MDILFILVREFPPTTALPEYRTTAPPRHSYDFRNSTPPPHHLIILDFLTIFLFIRISTSPPLYRSTAPPHHLTTMGPCILFPTSRTTTTSKYDITRPAEPVDVSGRDKNVHSKLLTENYLCRGCCWNYICKHATSIHFLARILRPSEQFVKSATDRHLKEYWEDQCIQHQ